MRGIWNKFRDKLLSELQIPAYIHQEFLQASVRKNDLSLQMVCVIIFVTEIFNIFRVLVLTRTKLGSQNNRIYFSMYCILLILAAVWMLLRRPLQRASLRVQIVLQHVLVCLFFFWHMGLNTYDLYRDPAAGTTVLTTALLGLALLIQAPPWYSAVQFFVYYLFFYIIMAPLLELGDLLNLTITFAVALVVALVNAHHVSMMLKQQKQIVEMNTRLQEMVYLDPLTGLLNKTTIECRAEQVLYSLEHEGSTGGLTLFLMDLDEFKGINDRYGHPCGDHVLVETAKALQLVFADAAGVGRIGGDEFAVLYHTPLEQEKAMDLGKCLQEQLGTITWQEQPLKVRCSIGGCICTYQGRSYRELYTETDRMLYQAKKTGRGKSCVKRIE